MDSKLITGDHASLPFTYDAWQTVRGLAFRNADGEWIACYQLCWRGEAYAIADFRNGAIERFDSAPRVLVTAREWLAILIAHLKG